jgi:hypothetical protein
MRIRRKHPAIRQSVGLFCLLAAAGTGTVSAQSGANGSAGEKSAIEALLVEVRQLRLALEYSTTLIARVQVAAQRLQAQQDRVDRLSRELREFRGQMALHASEKERTAVLAKEIESEAAQMTEPARRKELEEVARRMAFESVRHNARDQQEREQESQLQTQFQAEQARLDELAGHLSDLERKLDRQ